MVLTWMSENRYCEFEPASVRQFNSVAASFGTSKLEITLFRRGFRFVNFKAWSSRPQKGGSCLLARCSWQRVTAFAGQGWVDQLPIAKRMVV
jgi:hypothetical protein